LALVTAPDFLDRLLRQASTRLATGERLVIAIDALDEGGAGAGNNVFHLPKVLPRGVYLILSQRPVAVPLTFQNVTPEQIILRADAPENREDLRTYLKAATARPVVAGQLQAKGYRTETFIEKLAAASDGNWMYLAYVLAEIADGIRQPLDLDRLPLGLTGYYAEYWRRWQTRDEHAWDTCYAPLLATLTAAGEPIPADVLLAWSGADASLQQEKRLLREHWRAFIYELAVEAGSLYRPYHASLRDFLHGQVSQERLLPGEQGFVAELQEWTLAAHQSIASRYLVDSACWIQHNGYAFRHLSGHLAQAGMTGELGDLIENRAWYEAQRDYDPSLNAYSLSSRQCWRSSPSSARCGSAYRLSRLSYSGEMEVRAERSSPRPRRSWDRLGCPPSDRCNNPISSRMRPLRVILPALLAFSGSQLVSKQPRQVVILAMALHEEDVRGGEARPVQRSLDIFAKVSGS
jgi:hypothetical protein